MALTHSLALEFLTTTVIKHSVSIIIQGHAIYMHVSIAPFELDVFGISPLLYCQTGSHIHWTADSQYQCVHLRTCMSMREGTGTENRHNEKGIYVCTCVHILTLTFIIQWHRSSIISSMRVDTTGSCARMHICEQVIRNT